MSNIDSCEPLVKSLKYIFIYTDYMPSSKMNRSSPGAESRPGELFKSSSVGRPVGGSKPINRSPDRTRANISPRLQQHDVYRGHLSTSYSGNSIEKEISPNNSGSFHGHFPVHAMPSPLYSSQQMSVPIYMNHTPTTSLHNERHCLSQPVSRSTSRADSFKSNLTQLQIHTSDNHISPYYQYNKQMYQLSEYNYNAFNGQMQAAHACDPAVTSSQNFDPQYYNYQGYETDLSGSQHMNQFYHSQESFSSQLVDNQGMIYRSNDMMNPVISSYVSQSNVSSSSRSNDMMTPGISSYVSQSNMSSSSYQETERTLQEQEVLAPPPMFADMSELNDTRESKKSGNSYTSLDKIATDQSDSEDKQVSHSPII